MKAPSITEAGIQEQMQSPCVRCGKPIGTIPHYLTHDGLAHVDCEEEHYQKTQTRAEPMSEHPLQPIVERVKTDPFFVAYHLSRYATAHGLDDTTLANRLGCDLDRLPHVMLCRFPNPQSVSFRACILAIAEYVPCDADALQAILCPNERTDDNV